MEQSRTGLARDVPSTTGPGPVSSRPPEVTVESTLQELRAARQEQLALRRALALHDDLARLALDGASLTTLAARLAQLVGNPVLIENRFFRPLASASPPEAAGRDDRIPSIGRLLKDSRATALRACLQNERLPALVPANPERGVPYPRIAAPIVVLEDVVGYLSIVARDQPFDAAIEIAAREATLAIGLTFARQQAVFETELRLKGSVLDVLLQSGEVPGEVQATRASFLSYDFHLPQTLLVVALDPSPAEGSSPANVASPRDVAPLVTSWSRRVAAASLVTEKDGQVVILLARETGKPRGGTRPFSIPATAPARGDDRPEAAAPTELARSLRQELTSFLPGLTCSVAIAPPLRDLRELPHVYATARRALSIIRVLGERDTIIGTTDPRLAVFFLFDSTRPDARQEFVDLVLGPLIAYDQRRQRHLLATLEAYLACGGNLETTARTLNIHTSTLKYRLQRIAAVSGLDPRNADHRLNAALALKLRALGCGRPTDRGTSDSAPPAG